MEKTRPLIAVVDDEESVRRALVRLLHASQMDVDAYASGLAFLRSLTVRRPDCVVLDIQMAGLTGRDVQRQLAAAQLRLPVIILTAHDEPVMREQCLADGASAYLCKPLRADTLLSSIEAAIGQRVS
ncbi:MAG TPA: response regulator [Steroidobacteraceae bacterium]|nr:response regulator [Steroidobacteraceae bacterium]